MKAKNKELDSALKELYEGGLFMIRLGKRRTRRRFARCVCACALACAVSLTGLPSDVVVPLVQAEENIGSWVYNDNMYRYEYTDSNGWVYYSNDPKNKEENGVICYLVSIPESTTGTVKFPRNITIDGKTFKVQPDVTFELPNGVTLDTAPWVYDDDTGGYYYTDKDGIKYYSNEATNNYCVIESFPNDLTGELTFSPTVTIEGEQWELAMSTEAILPAGITSLKVEKGYSDRELSQDFFKNANSALVVSGWLDDGVCEVAEAMGIKVEYQDTIIDSQGIRYATIKDLNGKETNTVSVHGYVGEGGKVTIPKTLDNNYKVVEIGEGAFSNSKITDITIPSTIKKIGRSAFSGSSLTSIKIPNSIEVLHYTFAGCSKLKSITLPSNLRIIGDKVFYKCTSLTSVTIPNKVDGIGSSAFSGCSKLSKVKFGQKLIHINEYAFYKCASLTSITIPSSLDVVGRYAFADCKKLKNVTINSTIFSCIEEKAFSGDKALSGITLKSRKLNKNSIGKDAFKGTKKNLVIKVPSSKTASYKKFLNKFGNKTLKVKKL